MEQILKELKEAILAGLTEDYTGDEPFVYFDIDYSMEYVQKVLDKYEIKPKK